MLNPFYDSKVNFYGFFYFFFIISVLYLFIKKVKKSYILILWFALLFLYLEFGPVGIKINDGSFLIKYMLIFKRPRFSTILNIPVVLIISYFLIDISIKTKKILSIVIICFLLITSIYYINKSRDYLLSGMQAIKNAGSFLATQPKKDVYADFLAVGMLEYYLGYQRDEYVKNIQENSTEIKNAFVVDGGSRGVDLYWKVIDDERPSYLINPPKDWEIVKFIPNPMKKFDSNHRDLIIYYVPN